MLSDFVSSLFSFPFFFFFLKRKWTEVQGSHEAFARTIQSILQGLFSAAVLRGTEKIQLHELNIYDKSINRFTI